ncbi:putative membrane protein [Catalinimonas alkaloidigena]|uniref:Putative membrane protein n=1 Tax=Catalinimonas alkaloidigena TaxID=1075417 RepID=A0A1G8ZP10_9BACT|nr:bestrophin family ion channel [Catalinimonas alkaloidigena]SDK16798.1 putative membrane protein [Catalinimonas alkaloidigena]
MYVRRDIRPGLIWQFAWKNVLFFVLWSSLITFLYVWLKPQGLDISLPFLPLSTIGVAVAFYLGFKNSQSYDRFWEGRKIWGGIVNASRTWSNQVLGYVTNRYAREPLSEEELHAVHQSLIYRHLAWINALRIQLRQTTILDRKNLIYVPDLHLERNPACPQEIGPFLDVVEYADVIIKANPATHIVKHQGQALRQLVDQGLIEEFRHIDMMSTLRELYDLQGKCERIKNTPFPRQYAYFSTLFVWIFVILLPFGLVGEFGKISQDAFVWLTIPFSILISWVFTTMEIVGDNSEDPFENYVNDVPMTALCRTIEIDLREVLGETDLPPKIQPVDDILL